MSLPLPSPPCPKCGYFQATWRWHRALPRGWAPPFVGDRVDEHFVHICQRCQYVWTTDVPEERRDRPPRVGGLGEK
jgi:hypothetical protein